MSDGLDPFNEGLEGKGKYYPMVVLSMKKLLIDDTFADLVIKVGNESVHAHAGIVCVRCQEILGYPQEDKKKASKKKLEVKVKDVVTSAAIMSKVLEFLYTGMVDYSKMSDKEILHLIGASRYFKLDRLTCLSERWLREHMTIESVFHLLKAATDLKEDRIKGFCLAFALAHYNEFISNKDGIYILGIELFQEVVAAFQSNPTPPKEMRPEDTPDTLLEDFHRLYEQMPYSDITFDIKGELIKAHRGILASCSEALTSIFKDESALRTSPVAFRNMLEFVYYGNDEIEPIPACELVAFSRKFKLPSLLKICEDKIRASVSMKTVLPILSIAYLPAEGKQELVEELKSKCFPFILENLNKVDLSLIKASNPLMVVDLLLELQLAWKTGKYGLGTNLPTLSQKTDSSPPKASPRGGFSSAKKTSFEEGSRPRKNPGSGGLLGAQRRGPAPPPPRGRGRGGGTGARGGRPNPPTRTPSEDNNAGLEVPNTPAPAPPQRSQPPPPVAPHPSSVSDAPVSKKDKRDEERRKKEEAKRILKEKKERAKMEKKFKPKGKQDIF